MGSWLNGDLHANTYQYHADPHSPFSGFSLPGSTSEVKPSVYEESLRNLTQRTDANLHRLKEKLLKIDPCYGYGVEHWHPDHRKPTILEPEVYPEHACPRWETTNTMFTTKAKMDRLGWKRDLGEDSLSQPPGNGASICYLCSTLEEHQQHLARRGLQLKAKHKPKPKIEFIAPTPVTRVKKEKVIEEEKERLYKVIVRTGNKPNAATSANVFIKIKGTHGTLSKRKLGKKISVNFTFGRGTSETFYIKGPKLGDLQYLTIEHDGIEQKHSWFLENIEVKDVSNYLAWIFPCKQWLSLYLGDGILKRQLKAYIKEVEQIEYEIRVFTGVKSRSGTTSNVSLTLYGKHGPSPKFRLKNKKNADMFQKGKLDVFHKIVDDLGPIVKIRVEHDDTGESPCWFLEKIEVEDLDDPDRNYIFPCGQWLSSEKEESMIYRELYAITKRMAAMNAKKIEKIKHQTGDKKDGDLTKYEVTVVTGDRKYAGTDANVYLTMFGKHGKTAEIELDDHHKNNFEKGQTDIFKIEAANIGNIKRVHIRHDNSGLGAGWYLEKMLIKKFFNKEEILHRLHLMDAELDEEIAKREERERKTEKRSSSPQRLKHRKSTTLDSDDDKKSKKHRKKYDTDSEDEYDKYGRKKSRKHRSKYADSSSEEDKKKKKHKSKYASSDSEDDRLRKKRKGKKLIKYHGIEEWVTDSEEEYRKSKKRSSKYDSESDDDHKSHRKKDKYKSRKKYLDDSDDDKTSYRRKPKVRFNGKLNDEYSSDERKKKKKSKHYDSSESESDSEYERKRKKKKKKKLNRWHSSSEDSKTDSDSDGYRDKKKKGRKGRKDSTTESDTDSEESLTDVKAYTRFQKDRVPFCDEYDLPCHRWLAKDEDDGQISRELKPDSIVTFYRMPPKKGKKYAK